jgi:hypothetical protein
MARALYRSVTCNVLHDDPTGQRQSTIKEAWGRADVLKLNEAKSSPGIIRDLRGAKWFRPAGAVGENLPIIWRDTVFQKLDDGHHTAYVGGKGAGPSRGCTWVLLKHRASGKRVLEFNTHQIAKAFTSHTERQGTWNNILQGVADEVNRVKAKYPGVPIIISGDMNRDNGVNFPGLAEDQVTLGPTMGGNHYDQFFYIGQISPKSHAIFDTMSDHKAVVVNFEITTPDVVKPAAKPSASNPKPTESGKTETPHTGRHRPAPTDDLPRAAPLALLRPADDRRRRDGRDPAPRTPTERRQHRGRAHRPQRPEWHHQPRVRFPDRRGRPTPPRGAGYRDLGRGVRQHPRRRHPDPLGL